MKMTRRACNRRNDFFFFPCLCCQWHIDGLIPQLRKLGVKQVFECGTVPVVEPAGVLGIIVVSLGASSVGVSFSGWIKGPKRLTTVATRARSVC